MSFSLRCPTLPEVGVFGSMPVAVLCLVAVLNSAFLPFWMKSELTQRNSISPDLTPTTVSDIYVGLFGLEKIPGSKTRGRGGGCSRPLIWVCSSGYCMLSCGETSESRQADIEEIISGTYNSSSGDDAFCTPCQGSLVKAHDSDSGKLNTEAPTTTTATLTTTTGTPTHSSPTSVMVSESMLMVTRIFLLVGIVFTFVNIVFTGVNIVITPISAIFGIDGLVVWNYIAALCYLLVLCLWGVEYNMKLRINPGISDSLRESDIEWVVDSNIGWCCLLLILPLCLHLGLGTNFAYRQYKRYYSAQKRNEAQQRVQVQDPTQGGTDILF